MGEITSAGRRITQSRSNAERCASACALVRENALGPSGAAPIAETSRALLVTCFWYIRTVDPQTALVTGLTRDGVFLVERGEVKGAVNNFRWNMSPIAALAQTTQIGRCGMALPRRRRFLRSRPPCVERFNMSSVSEAS
jgi:hypothetical protein